MNNFFRALIAGYGAKKLGGGCLGTVLVFIVIWVALGQCSLKERDRVMFTSPKEISFNGGCSQKPTLTPTEAAIPKLISYGSVSRFSLAGFPK
jgi:hypothetical protein